jgi:hypothetical protein
MLVGHGLYMKSTIHDLDTAVRGTSYDITIHLIHYKFKPLPV